MSPEENQNSCPATRILTLLSKKHMLLLLHTLTKGEPLGFNGLQKKLNINTASLSRRLQELEEEGLIERNICPNDSRFHYYKLTKRGVKINTLLKQLT